MCKRYLKVEYIIKYAHQSIIGERGAAASASTESLSPAEIVLLEDLVQILQVVNGVTMLVGKPSGPTIQDVDFLRASIVARLDKCLAASCTGSIAQGLQKCILHCQCYFLNELLIIGLVDWCFRFLHSSDLNTKKDFIKICTKSYTSSVPKNLSGSCSSLPPNSKTIQLIPSTLHH